MIYDDRFGTLDTKNKMCSVDGSLPKLEHGATDEKAWIRCNNMI